jgi:hypothetical protein
MRLIFLYAILISDLLTTACQQQFSNKVLPPSTIFVSAFSSVPGDTQCVMTSPDGVNWTLRSIPAIGSEWECGFYGNSLFVFAGIDATGTHQNIMTSPDGINWTFQNAPAGAPEINAIAYGNGLFVAVFDTGYVHGGVMTSPDGINWTLRSSPDNRWGSIHYADGLFIATASHIPPATTGQDMMTSPDGINWTLRSSPTGMELTRIAYGSGLFVIIGGQGGGTGDVMTSPGGINWTIRDSGHDRQWISVTYANSLFVVISYNDRGTGQSVMTSPDGINWTLRNSPASGWRDIVYGNGLFVVENGDIPTGEDIMTSPDGINWTLRNTPLVPHTSDLDSWYSLACNADVGANATHSADAKVNLQVHNPNFRFKLVAAPTVIRRASFRLGRAHNRRLDIR